MRPRRHNARRRAGLLAPALVAALAATLLITATVLHIEWRRACDRELSAAADAAALAAAAELACDERLLEGALPDAVFSRVAARATELAGRHRVGGGSAELGSETPRCGCLVRADEGRELFLESRHRPTAVDLTCGRRSNDGRSAFLSVADGETPLVRRAAAAIANRVAELRPRRGGSVKMWPLALRANSVEADESGERVAGWSDVAAGLGLDEYRFDRDTGTVVAGRDGLPELVVRTLGGDGETDRVSLTLIDAGQSFSSDALTRVFRDGFTTDDLAALGGRVPVTGLAGTPITVDAAPTLPVEAEYGLGIGAARPLFLFGSLTGSPNGDFTATLTGVVAARLMDLRPLPDGAWQATFQAAVVVVGSAETSPDADESPYLFKTHLIR